jgi:glycosyltransferase involved in cell wall biosynthesis
MKNRCLQHGFRPEHLQVIGQFTDVQPDPEDSVNEATPVVLFMGQIDRYKGVDYLLNALALVRAPFECVIIGTGPYLSYCRDLMAKLGLTDAVQFLGWLPRDETKAYLRSARMLVVPSILPEAFGMVGIEAMACSKPVIAFDSGGISDWLQDGKTGYLVPAKDISMLADRIASLLQDPHKAAAMGREGRRLAMGTFNKEAHFDRLLSIFETISDVHSVGRYGSHEDIQNPNAEASNAARPAL